MARSPESLELLKYLEELTQSTRNGTIDWKEANPTTYVWESRTRHDRAARVSLQRVDRNIQRTVAGRNFIQRETHYILQAFELPMPIGNPQQKFSASGAEDQEVNEKLRILFEEVQAGVARKGLQFLREFLPPV